MRDLQQKHENELAELTDKHNEEASELQDRLDDHDNLARIIHEVRSEDAAEHEFDDGANAEKDALIDEQQRMREELRKKHEEETKAIEDEEQEDAVIDNIEDRHQLVLTALKIENDLQLEMGAIPSQVHDQRVEGYAQIEAQNSLLTRKRVELSEKRKAFAKANRRWMLTELKAN